MTQSCGGRGDPWGPDIQRESERTRTSGGKLLGVRSKHRAFQKLKASKGEERQSEGGRKVSRNVKNQQCKTALPLL